jgi:hypothetical protein
VTDPYRGDETASALRLARLDAEIAERERRLTDAFWRDVAPAWNVPPTLEPSDDPRTDREARIALLDQALERARSGPWADVRLPPPKLERVDRFDELPLRLKEGPPIDIQPLLAVARFHASGGELEYRGFREWAVRFEADGAPLELRARPDRGSGRGFPEVLIRTTVCPTARLSLRGEGVARDVLEFLGLVEPQIEVDDADFDGIFLVEGDEQTARTWLTPDARIALLAQDLESTPVLEAVDGLATFRTRTATKPALMRLTSLLVTWHALPSPTPLLDLACTS